MATTNFIDQVTVVEADWLNEVDNLIYGIFGITDGTIPATQVFDVSAGTLVCTTGGSLTGTWTDLGTVTTIDIDGGSIDGTIIGANAAAAATVTTFNSTLITDTGSAVGIGEGTPLGELHIKTGDAGAGVSIDVSADEFVIEGSGNTGMTIVSGNTSLGAILFGDDGDTTLGFVQYDNSDNSMDIGTNGTTAISMTSSQQVGIGETIPLGELHVRSADAGVGVTVGTSYDELVLEGSGATGMTIVAGNTNKAGIAFADDGDNDAGTFYFDHALGAFALAKGGSVGIIWDGSDNVGIGEPSPLGKLHIRTGDTTASVASGADELVVEGSAGSGVTILSGVSSLGQLRFGDSGDNNIGGLYYDHSTNKQHHIANAATSALVLTGSTVGINETTPLGALHVKTADLGGGLAPGSNYDELVLENTAHCGITIAAGATSKSGVAFADLAAGNAGTIYFDHNVNEFHMGIAGTDALVIDSNRDMQSAGSLALNSGGGTQTTNGTIRYSGTDIEGRLSGTWVSLTGSGTFKGFRAVRATTVQLGVGGAYTKVQFNSETFDPQSDYDHSTNYRYTPSTAGKYQVNASVSLDVTSPLAGANIKIAIYKNGSLHSESNGNVDVADNFDKEMTISDIVDMNGSTDYIEIFVHGPGTASVDVDSFFSAGYLGA